MHGTNPSNLNEQLKCSADVHEELGTEAVVHTAEYDLSKRVGGRHARKKGAADTHFTYIITHYAY
jgi:hypothetical protein